MHSDSEYVLLACGSLPSLSQRGHFRADRVNFKYLSIRVGFHDGQDWQFIPKENVHLLLGVPAVIDCQIPLPRQTTVALTGLFTPLPVFNRATASYYT